MLEGNANLTIRTLAEVMFALDGELPFGVRATGATGGGTDCGCSWRQACGCAGKTDVVGVGPPGEMPDWASCGPIGLAGRGGAARGGLSVWDVTLNSNAYGISTLTHGVGSGSSSWTSAISQPGGIGSKTGWGDR